MYPIYGPTIAIPSTKQQNEGSFCQNRRRRDERQDRKRIGGIIHSSFPNGIIPQCVKKALFCYLRTTGERIVRSGSSVYPWARRCAEIGGIAQGALLSSAFL